MAVEHLAFPHLFSHSSASLATPGTPFPDWPAKAAPCPSHSYADAQKVFETEFITQALREHGGNVSRTAEAIGMTRRNLQVKIQKLGIDVEAMRPRSRGARHE